jgi:hypothetical protein
VPGSGLQRSIFSYKWLYLIFFEMWFPSIFEDFLYEVVLLLVMQGKIGIACERDGVMHNT